MEQIYYSKHFGHIDLAKILTVSDPKFSSGGQYIGFDVLIDGRDEPLTYMRSLTSEEREWVPQIGHSNAGKGQYWKIRTIKGQYKRFLKISTDNDYTDAEEHIQEEINDFVNAWKSYCTAYAVSHFPRAISTSGPNSY